MHLSTALVAVFGATAFAQLPTNLPSGLPTGIPFVFPTPIPVVTGAARPTGVGFQFPGFTPSNTFQFLSQHPYIPAGSLSANGAGVSRSPCPLLNTLANHGFLPRDGKNITTAKFISALTESVNLSPDFGKTLAEGAFQKLNVPTTGSISLNELNAHGTLEHDASLTRLDAKQGPADVVQPARVRDLLNDIQPPTYKYVNATSLGRSRARVEKASVDAGSPALSAQDQTTAKGEAALILLVLGKPLNNNSADLEARSIDKEVLSQFFLQERFNVEGGWVKSEKQFDLAADMLPLIAVINQHQIQATAPPELPSLGLPSLPSLTTGARFRA